jgi:hypothetical protein
MARPFRAEDLVALLGVIEPGQVERHRKTAATREGWGPAYTFFCHHGELLACAGVSIHWEGLGEVWMVMSPHAGRHLLEVVVWAGRMLDKMQEDLRLRRLQADVVADDEKANSFVRHYGFVAEGLMRRYDVLGRDTVRYARIREV